MFIIVQLHIENIKNYHLIRLVFILHTHPQAKHGWITFGCSII